MTSLTPPAPHALSVWAATAASGPVLAPLSRALQVDVAIIGAGFTGLAAAHHLTRAGVECAVLEAHDVGWGASGRNGGMAVMRYKSPWARLAARYGDKTALHLHKLLLEAADTLEETVEELAIDCGWSRCGHLSAAHGRAAGTMFAADLAWLARVAHDRAPRLVGRGETAELTGTSCYLDSYLDPRAGGIHPLAYCRGIAAGLVRRGVAVHAATPVLALQEDADGIALTVPGATVRARQVIVATNAYTNAYPLGTGLATRIVPVATSVITTAPLPEPLRRAILPQGHLVSDTRHLLNYFRMAPGNRLLFGGRGSLSGREAPEIYRGLEDKLVATFPALAGVAIDHRWSGHVAVTLDDFPHIGRASPRIAYALGYGGRGVALTNLLGKLLARLVRGEKVNAGPMSDNAFAAIPLHGLRVPAMKAVAGYYRVLDALRL